MNFAIYALMMMLLADIYEMPNDVKEGMTEVSRFVTFLYPLAWFHAPFPADSAPLDSILWSDLDKYER
jgi:hypothetical protein